MNKVKRLLLQLRPLWLWLRRLWPRRHWQRRSGRDKGWAWRLRWRRNGRNQAEEDCLEQQLWQAHREWQLAQHRMDQALEADEVDYAVLMLEASEKRYGMLIKKAKAAGLTRKEWHPGGTNKRLRHSPSADGRKEEATWTRDG